MCGLCGVATSIGYVPSADAAVVARIRDRMERRGPDGSGLWPPEHHRQTPPSHVILGHRRLAVIDPTPAGHQPFISDDGLGILLYNGALYNDAALRDRLANHGHRFRSNCDTETVLTALTTWGMDALPRLRGMYAIAYYDRKRETLLLARDPLGIKSLYWWEQSAAGVREIAFASEPRALLAHPAIAARPDIIAVSAYLTTIRTTLDDRTLFLGIRSLRPGEAIEFDLRDAALPMRRSFHIRLDREMETRAHPPGSTPADQSQLTNQVRSAVIDSVTSHLRADVPSCCLLSGGLDSTIVATIASRHMPPDAPPLRTYCSGTSVGEDDDLTHARRVSARLGTLHAQAPISREIFSQRWRSMVRAMRSPLSTPNEVAINEVARCLRADGVVVALSGEGADELFGGYGIALDHAAAYIAGRADLHADAPDGGTFQLFDAAWIAPREKSSILNADAARRSEGDAALRAHYRDEFVRLREDCDDDLSAHLRFSRRINLPGLLQRLDTATMLEGVEGRTPFADASLAALAESLPIGEKFHPADHGGDPHTAFAGQRTKRCLRRAFAHDLPTDVLSREKASFPLPFQEWLPDTAPVIRRSAFAKEMFTREAIDAVAANPTPLWRLAWPMINLALWGEVFE